MNKNEAIAQAKLWRDEEACGTAAVVAVALLNALEQQDPEAIRDHIIADVLESTGQYVTNDASREAALAEARIAALEEAAKVCDQSSVQPALAKMIRALQQQPAAAQVEPLSWKEARYIVNMDSVHEALSCFSHDSTEDNAVALIQEALKHRAKIDVMQAEIDASRKLRSETDKTLVFKLLMLIDPAPVDMPDGTKMVFKNPNAADMLTRISAIVREHHSAIPPQSANGVESK